LSQDRHKTGVRDLLVEAYGVGREVDVFNLWNSIGMKKDSFIAGDIISFFNRVRRILR
jgi:hypothetical protein